MKYFFNQTNQHICERSRPPSEAFILVQRIRDKRPALAGVGRGGHGHKTCTNMLQYFPSLVRHVSSKDLANCEDH